MKPCNQKNPKASDPGYECNPKTGRWIKNKTTQKKKTNGIFTKPTTATVCQKKLLEEFDIRIPKSVTGTKVIFLKQDVAKFNPQRLKHEVIHYDPCYFHYSWIPKNALTPKNKLWEGVKSYRDLVSVTLRFMNLFPPLYPLPHSAQQYTSEQKIQKFKERQENKNQLRYFAQILTSFVKTFERLPTPALPMPTPSQMTSLSNHLKERGILPFRSFTMETEPDVSNSAFIQIFNDFKILTQSLTAIKK